MKKNQGIELTDVTDVYNGPEGDLWELVMGEQIHIGGLASSMSLAEQAGVGDGMRGVDLCCCSGAGMRFLLRFRGVASMIGVDATETVVRRGEERCVTDGCSDRTRFLQEDVCASSLPSGEADFVWGEDAWCYVIDKPKLISEAARLVRSGGTIAFTDWVEGNGLSDEEAGRFMAFMKFPNVESIEGYAALLSANDCEVISAEDTQQFAPHIDLYLQMLNMQLTYDALRIIGFDQDLMGALATEMVFMQELAHAGKIKQGRFVARKR